MSFRATARRMCTYCKPEKVVQAIPEVTSSGVRLTQLCTVAFPAMAVAFPVTNYAWTLAFHKGQGAGESTRVVGNNWTGVR